MPQVLLFKCTVYGKPQPAGSKRGFVNPKTKSVIITDDNRNAKPWQHEVAGAATKVATSTFLFQEGNASRALPKTGPLSLLLEFYLRRPKGHYGTGKNAGRVKDSAPCSPAVKPDTSKLVRAVEDALTGIVWHDDAQIIYQVAAKHYGLPERCEIKVYG